MLTSSVIWQIMYEILSFSDKSYNNLNWSLNNLQKAPNHKTMHSEGTSV